MIPADIKKKENIAEYIIHMYQSEDLIKTYDYNLDEILEYVIKHMSKDEAELKQLLLWYAGLIEAMNEEKVSETNLRLSTTQEYVKQLSILHKELLTVDEAYNNIYNEASHDIQDQIAESDMKITDPVQVCLNAVYGKLLINLDGKKLNPELEKMVKKFGDLLAYLTKAFHAKES